MPPLDLHGNLQTLGPNVAMLLKQFYLNCLAHASYLIADPESGSAVVVDPQRDVERYLSEAARQHVEIRHTFLTHFHADFIAGHLELRDRVGAKIALGAKAKAEYEFTPMHEGDVLNLGHVRLEILETPGHTIESISILVYNLNVSETKPYAVLTGDTLFIGDVGRPDLRGSLGWSPAQLGAMLYHSLRDKLLKLPDECLVYPTHGAGSLCGRSLSTETVSTIGTQRQSNYALQPMSEEEFIRLVTADQPDAPPYFTYDAVLNAKERPTLGSALARSLHPLSLDEVLEQQSRGGQILDVRRSAEFAQAHLRGSINIGLEGQYATWAGTILSRENSIVVIAPPGQEEEAAMRLGRIGFDNVAGYLKGGIHALETRPDLVDGTKRLAAAECAAELALPGKPFLLDVRSPGETREKRIAGSINIPLNHLRERLGEVPRDRAILLHCAGGYRSSIAASLLQQYGFEDLTELAGGITAWEAARFALETGAAKNSQSAT